MGRQLKVATVVSGKPGSGVSHLVLVPGDEVPEWAVGQIGDHCWADDESSETASESESESQGEAPVAPPKAGPGSGTEAWAAHATALGVEVPEGAGRDQIVTAISDAGHPVE